jgi:hypothetical protein
MAGRIGNRRASTNFTHVELALHVFDITWQLPYKPGFKKQLMCANVTVKIVQDGFSVYVQKKHQLCTGLT